MNIMTFALVLALGAVVLTVLLRGAPDQAVASERAVSTKSSAAPLIRGESSLKPWEEKTKPLSTPGGSNVEPVVGLHHDPYQAPEVTERLRSLQHFHELRLEIETLWDEPRLLVRIFRPLPDPPDHLS